MIHRNIHPLLLAVALAAMALFSTTAGLRASPLETFNMACGTTGTGVQAPVGWQGSATAPTLGAAMAAAFMALFQYTPHSCEACPPEKPDGCRASRTNSGCSVTQTENGDGSWTVTVTAGEGNSSVGGCSECFGEEPL
jgi:hypothetical protein